MRVASAATALLCAGALVGSASRVDAQTLAPAATDVARARPQAADETSEPTRAEDRAHLAFLEASLARNADAMRPWFWGWATFDAVLIAAESGVVAASSNANQRLEARVQLVAGALGLASLLLAVPPSLLAKPTATGDGEREPPQARRTRLEKRLAHAADVERANRSMFAHLAGFALAVGAGLYVWAAEGRAGSGIWVGLGTAAVNEIQIATQPTVAIDATAAPTPSSSDAGVMMPRIWVQPRIGMTGEPPIRPPSANFGFTIVGTF